jgi:Mg2+-importing ATPase
MGQIARFIVLIGPCSSLFAATTFLVLLFVFGCVDPARIPLFHTGWFVESLVTQTLVIHVIRTDRIPFLKSRASFPLTATTLAVAVCGIGLTESSVAPLLGFTPLPATFWPVLVVNVVVYGLTVHLLKRHLVHGGWIT